jgi:hypothetical protein
MWSIKLPKASFMFFLWRMLQIVTVFILSCLEYICDVNIWERPSGPPVRRKTTAAANRSASPAGGRGGPCSHRGCRRSSPWMGEEAPAAARLAMDGTNSLRRQAWLGSAMVCVSWCKFWSPFEANISGFGFDLGLLDYILTVFRGLSKVFHILKQWQHIFSAILYLTRIAIL